MSQREKPGLRTKLKRIFARKKQRGKQPVEDEISSFENETVDCTYDKTDCEGQSIYSSKSPDHTDYKNWVSVEPCCSVSSKRVAVEHADTGLGEEYEDSHTKSVDSTDVCCSNSWLGDDERSLKTSQTTCRIKHPDVGTGHSENPNYDNVQSYALAYSEVPMKSAKLETGNAERSAASNKNEMCLRRWQSCYVCGMNASQSADAASSSVRNIGLHGQSLSKPVFASTGSNSTARENYRIIKTDQPFRTRVVANDPDATHTDTLVQWKAHQNRPLESSIYTPVDQRVKARESSVYTNLSEPVRARESSVCTHVDQRVRALDSNVYTNVDQPVRALECSVYTDVDQRVRALESSVYTIVDQRVRALESSVYTNVDQRVRALESSVYTNVYQPVRARQSRVYTNIDQRVRALESNVCTNLYQPVRTRESSVCTNLYQRVRAREYNSTKERGTIFHQTTGSKCIAVKGVFPADQGRNLTSEQRQSDVGVRRRRQNDVVPTSETDRWSAGFTLNSTKSSRSVELNPKSRIKNKTVTKTVQPTSFGSQIPTSVEIYADKERDPSTGDQCANGQPDPSTAEHHAEGEPDAWAMEHYAEGEPDAWAKEHYAEGEPDAWAMEHYAERDVSAAELHTRMALSIIDANRPNLYNQEYQNNRAFTCMHRGASKNANYLEVGASPIDLPMTFSNNLYASDEDNGACSMNSSDNSAMIKAKEKSINFSVPKKAKYKKEPSQRDNENHQVVYESSSVSRVNTIELISTVSVTNSGDSGTFSNPDKVDLNAENILMTSSSKQQHVTLLYTTNTTRIYFGTSTDIEASLPANKPIDSGVGEELKVSVDSEAIAVSESEREVSSRDGQRATNEVEKPIIYPNVGLQHGDCTKEISHQLQTTDNHNEQKQGDASELVLNDSLALCDVDAKDTASLHEELDLKWCKPIPDYSNGTKINTNRHSILSIAPSRRFPRSQRIPYPARSTISSINNRTVPLRSQIHKADHGRTNNTHLQRTHSVPSATVFPRKPEVCAVLSPTQPSSIPKHKIYQPQYLRIADVASKIHTSLRSSTNKWTGITTTRPPNRAEWWPNRPVVLWEASNTTQSHESIESSSNRPADQPSLTPHRNDKTQSKVRSYGPEVYYQKEFSRELVSTHHSSEPRRNEPSISAKLGYGEIGSKHEIAAGEWNRQSIAYLEGSPGFARHEGISSDPQRCLDPQPRPPIDFATPEWNRFWKSCLTSALPIHRVLPMTIPRLRYRMASFPLGLAVVIVNENVEGFSPREGADRDRENLLSLWLALGFDVHVYKNLTKAEMVNTIREYAARDHSDYDAFCVSISTHGFHGHVLSCDNLAVNIESDIVEPLSNCETLRGKPKLCFIQACQTPGYRRSNADEDESARQQCPYTGSSQLVTNTTYLPEVHYSRNRARVGTRNTFETDAAVTDVDSQQRLNIGEDCFVSFASPNNLTWRHLLYGSIYPTSLKRSLLYHSPGHDLEKILSKGVRPGVEKLTHLLGGQSPDYVTSLIREVCFPRIHLISECTRTRMRMGHRSVSCDVYSMPRTYNI